MKINNKLAKLSLSIVITAACSTIAFADGNAFTPLNFDDASTYSSTPKTTTAAPATASAPKTQSTNPLSNALSKIMPKQTPAAQTANGEVPIGNDSIQNAILELDNAQVGIRNDLLTYKAKYADADAQYKLIKNERAMLHRQVVSIERRIRSIDRAKEKIRKNML